jgi:hypothetical protein
MIPVADQFEDIRKRREEIAREEGKAGAGGADIIQPPCDTEQPRMEDYACGWRPIVVHEQVLRQKEPGRAGDIELLRWMHAHWLKTRTPGEFTDGA